MAGYSVITIENQYPLFQSKNEGTLAGIYPRKMIDHAVIGRSLEWHVRFCSVEVVVKGDWEGLKEAILDYLP